MRIQRSFFMLVFAGFAVAAVASPCQAAGPRNPYSSFNLSGINYGAQQWDRDQRAGRAVWPYYNTPSRNSSRGSTVRAGGFVGGGAGGMIQNSSSRSTPRAVRRWRR